MSDLFSTSWITWASSCLPLHLAIILLIGSYDAEASETWANTLCISHHKLRSAVSFIIISQNPTATCPVSIYLGSYLSPKRVKV